MRYDRFNGNGYSANGAMGYPSDPYAPRAGGLDAIPTPTPPTRYGPPSSWQDRPASPPPASTQRPDDEAAYLAGYISPDQIEVLLRAYLQATTDLHAGNVFRPSREDVLYVPLLLQYRLLSMEQGGYVLSKLGLHVLIAYLGVRLSSYRD